MSEIIRGVEMREDSFVGSTSYLPRNEAAIPSVAQQPYAPFSMNPFSQQGSIAPPPPQINAKQAMSPSLEQQGTFGSLYLRTGENFIFKVYSILTVQLIITAAFCAVTVNSLDFLQFQYTNQWLMWVALSLMLVTQIAIFVCPAGRMHPVNSILLLLFTLCMSYFVSYFCGIVAVQSGTNLVLMAALMTLGLAGILTIFAIIFPVEDSLWVGVGVVTVFSFILFGIFCGVGWCSTLTNLYCALGVIGAGIFVLIDSTLLLGNSHFQLSTDDYVVGALILYIDIIKLFIYILSLISRKRWHQ